MFVKKIKLTVAIGRNKTKVSTYTIAFAFHIGMCLSERVRMLKNGEPHNVLRKIVGFQIENGKNFKGFCDGVSEHKNQIQQNYQCKFNSVCLQHFCMNIKRPLFANW